MSGSCGTWPASHDDENVHGKADSKGDHRHGNQVSHMDFEGGWGGCHPLPLTLLAYVRPLIPTNKRR